MHWFVESTDIGWVGCNPDLVRERRVGRHEFPLCRGPAQTSPPSQGTSGAVDLFHVAIPGKGTKL